MVKPEVTRLRGQVPVQLGSVDATAESINLNADVSASGSIVMNGAVALGANTVASGSAMTFAGTVDGAFDLTVNSSGVTEFGRTHVGDSTPLTSITTDAGGTTRLKRRWLRITESTPLAT